MTRSAAAIIGISVIILTDFGSTPAALARPHLPGAAIFQSDGSDGSAPAGSPDGSAPTGGSPDGKAPDSGNSDDSADNATDPHWHPNVSLLKGLTHVTKVGPYAISLPPGMQIKKQPYLDEHLTGSMYECLGTKHSGYPGLVILAGVVRCRPGYTLETIGTEQMDLIDAIESQFDSQQDVTKSDKEEGSVNGMTATRNYYKFTLNKSGAREHGFNYVAITNNVLVVVGGMSPEPANKKDLAFAEALSLRFLQTVAKHQ